MSNGVDLFKLFQAVSGTLKENQTALNQADDHNRDHGDNMVEIFELITQAIGEQKGAEPAGQLSYASELLKKKSKSGSAALYAEGLAHASELFMGQKQVDPGNAMQLIQSLMSAGKPSAAPSGNPFGALLSGLAGGGGQGGDDKFDAEDLLSAGLSFLAAKNRGESTAEALVEAVIAGSPFGQTPHRAQSSQLVMNTLFDVMSSMAGK